MSTKTAQCEILGEVVIRSLKWTQKLKIQADEYDQAFFVPDLLFMSVVDSKGKPIKSVDEWDDFIGEHQEEALSLFNQCMELHDFGGKQAVKK